MTSKTRVNVRFSLRSLLIAVAVCGPIFVGVAYWYRDYYQPRAMETRWESKGTIIIRGTDKEGNPDTILIATRGPRMFDVGSLRELGELPNLVILVLSDTSVGNDDMQFVAKVESLRTVALDGTAVDDQGLKALANMPRLKTLSLKHTGVSDESVDVIAEMKGLTDVIINGTAISAAGVQRLMTLRPDVEVHCDYAVP